MNQITFFCLKTILTLFKVKIRFNNITLVCALLDISSQAAFDIENNRNVTGLWRDVSLSRL